MGRPRKTPGTRQAPRHYADIPGDRPLTPKQQRFVAHYLRTLNGAKAARLAGYAPEGGPKVQAVIAAQNLAKPNIKRRLEARLRDALEKADLSVHDVLLAIQRMVRHDIRKLFDEDGNHLPVHVLDGETAARIIGVEYVTKNVDSGDGHTDRIYKLKLEPRAPYVEMAAKYFGLLREKIELSGNEEFIAELQAARKRMNKVLAAAKDVTPVKRKRLKEGDGA